jgi:hypothetical protein
VMSNAFPSPARSPHQERILEAIPARACDPP